MPLYSSELEVLKKELADLRKFKKFFGFEGDELLANEYMSKSYTLSEKTKKKLNQFVKEQERDLNSFAKSPTITELDLTDLEENAEKNFRLQHGLQQNSNSESELDGNDGNYEDKYFNAPDLDLLFDHVFLESYHMLTPSEELLALDECHHSVEDLDRIFQYETNRVKLSKTSVNNAMLLQKVAKVHDKIKQNKVNEASVLISRFYNENKQDILLGYLYSEILYAKTALGNPKSLSKARSVSNTVCFLTDKSDEELISYYRYIYVCREFNNDKDRALQLFRDFVLINEDKIISSSLLTQRRGFYLKCLLLFLKFETSSWNSYEIETMAAFSHKSLSGGSFYVEFIRKNVLRHIDSVRFHKFLQVEIDLYNLKKSHAKLIGKIKDNFAKSGLPKNGSQTLHTVGQKYLQKFFLIAKLPTFSDYLTNVSISGVHYLENTENDKHLAANGMSEHSFWRSWVSKITSEPSLQRSDIIPIEQVLSETKLLVKYDSLIKKFNNYELEIFNKEEFLEVRDLLGDIGSKGVVAVILGENKYSVFDYGQPWTGIRDYYLSLKLSHQYNCKLASELLQQKGKDGVVWNLEEIQLMLDSINLIIDNKRLGLKARLETIIEKKEEESVDDQYMSISEHIEIYWWLYVVLVSLLILFFNLIG